MPHEAGPRWLQCELCEMRFRLKKDRDFTRQHKKSN